MATRSGSASTIWQTTLGELQLQLPRETYDTWLRHARLVAHEDGSYIVGVANVYAREWLEHRLKKVILRTLSQVAGRNVEITFVLLPDDKQEEEIYSAGPLLNELRPEKDSLSHQFKPLSPGETGLNPRLTFENYAVGLNNRLAHAAASAVVKAPAEQFNPLYIQAGVGIGKSHLLHAIGNACVEQDLLPLYISAETFTNDLVASIKSKKTAEFRQKYRTVDVLLVDDIEFIAGKDSTQEEFFHTFNDLIIAGAQIVIAGSKPPGDIRALDKRLRSRFEGGLLVELVQPDYEQRLDILLLKADQRGYAKKMSYEILETIAADTEGSVRELEGGLNRVIATSLLTQQPLTVSTAKESLNQLKKEDQRLTVQDILMAVAEYYDLDPEDITGRTRSREVSTARQVVMYIGRKYADISLQQIGDDLGGRNHSTVLYAFERVSELMAVDSQVRQDIQSITKTLRPATRQNS